MIFQEPMASFAPAITIGDQMVEQLLLHSDMSKEGRPSEHVHRDAGPRRHLRAARSASINTRSSCRAGCASAR
jgi:ABC-type dipeptide/oligopeptide/nickel transport system ATPase component